MLSHEHKPGWVQPMLHSLVFIAVCVLTLSVQVLHAEEGGSGHYLPGSVASFMDGVSPTEAFIARINLPNYDGKV